jgi:hypothetical protein
MAAEVAEWLARLTASDPATAELVDRRWPPCGTRAIRVNVERWLMICG